jgi:NitT/TauT family transport system ATP-binding protein
MERLKIDHVTKVFNQGKPNEHIVLYDLNFSVEDGEFICLLGPSGCGKTTLLTMMGGFQEPSMGDSLLDGVPIHGPSAERGYVFQNYALFPWMTVEKNIAYAMKYLKMSKEEKQERMAYLLEMAQLWGHEKKYPIQLSGGMQQRVAMARALAGRPKVLFLDEPLGAVDFQMRELMQNELEQMVQAAKITVVMVTHDVSESVFFSDRVIVMGSNQGHILADVHIDLPRPRDRETEEFEHYVGKLTSLVRQAFQERNLTTAQDVPEIPAEEQ